MPSKQKVSLLQFAQYCFKAGFPFAFYRLPDEKTIRVVAQKAQHIQNTTIKSSDKGFLFSPFCEDGSQRILIAPDIACTETTLPNIPSVYGHYSKIDRRKEKIKPANKREYLKLIRKIKREIERKQFKKIVSARVVKVSKPAEFQPVSYFRLLCSKHRDAFVSMIYTPVSGLWIGASPEILLQAKATKMKTFSLAGTAKKATKKSLQWGNKEKQEHQIVSEYILKSFSKLTDEEPLVEGPITVSAGKLLHLRTTFTYSSLPYSKWPDVVQRLHPTPAVAGLPKRDAIDFILKHEKSNRDYYSGFLGPVNIDKQVNLFVNLRCMQVLKNKLAIYVGGGITADSNPMDEWHETKIKADTLLSLLKNQ